MTTNEIKIAIAESRGWTDAKISVVDGKLMHGQTEVPPYTSSRDAMATALEGLTDEEWGRYFSHLHSMLNPLKADGILWIVSYNWQKIYMATPLQQAEAYLKAKGLWKEGK